MRRSRSPSMIFGSASARITTAERTSHSDAPRRSMGATLRRPKSPDSSIYAMYPYGLAGSGAFIPSSKTKTGKGSQSARYQRDLPFRTRSFDAGRAFVFGAGG